MHISEMIADKVRFFKSLGQECRLRILSYLLDHRCCACDFESLVDKDQSTISRHLKVLVEAGILEKERSGKNVIYTIGDDELRKTLRSLGIDQIEPCC